MDFLAHIAEDGREQALADHLRQTAVLCEENSVRLFKSIAHAVGPAHDIGKYAKAFRAGLHGGKKHFEHSACGAIKYREKFENSSNTAEKNLAPMLEFCIACHHTGLQDGGSKSGNKEGAMNYRISESEAVKRLKKGAAVDYSELGID